MTSLLEKINILYPFSQPVRIIKKVRKGYLTTKFIIGNDKKKYFLKGYRDPVLRVKNTHKAKEFFSNNGIPVILPIQNKNEKTFFVHNGEVYSVFPYIEGEQFEKFKVPEIALREAGKMLAKLHLLSKDRMPIGIRKRKFIVDKEKSISRVKKIIDLIDKKKSKTTFDKASLARLKLKLDLIQNNRIKVATRKLGKRHIIHADYHEANIFFKNNKIIYVFDWEMVSCAPRVMEIARSVDFFCFNGNFKPKNFSMAKTYLSAYNNIYPINKEELFYGLHAWCYNRLHSVWSSEEYYLKNKKLSAGFIKREIRTIEYYYRNLEEFIGKIVENY
jgi:Ser/Thr protein kinase RdoA (MazF antagonist)